jgi:hypothetical protein
MNFSTQPFLGDNILFSTNTHKIQPALTRFEPDVSTPTHEQRSYLPHRYVVRLHSIAM